MKIQELRIGNYINHSELSGITEVIAIGKDYIHILFNNETLYESIKWFTPIPLTEEWLLKFDFTLKSDIDGEYYEKNGVKVLILRSETIHFFFGNPYTKEKYVHELQNYFHINTGEELTLHIS
ncbi:hypothetical protein CMU07_09240 [Elizabethkingia anophelis]|nr:hypothetical protein [Elizabethkingia anophelis]